MVIRRLTRQPRPQSEAKPAWGSGVYALSPVGSSSTSLYSMSMSVLGLLWRCFWCGPWPGSLSAVEAAASAKGSAGSVCSRYGDCALEGADSNVQLLQLDLAMPSGGSDIASFLWLTDAHVDPYYTSSDRQCIKKQTPQLGHYPFGVIGCDPPPALLHSILEGAAGWLRDHADTSFVLFTGDFVRHGLSRMQGPGANATDIVRNVSALAKSYFPDLPMVFGTLGNDDSSCDYCQDITTSSTVNKWFWNIGKAISDAGCMTNATLQTYKYGGFFDTTVGDLTILSISTVIYSIYHIPASQIEDDPFGQLAWLREKLTQAVQRGRRVWIIGHIPPGIETFGFTELWWPVYLAKYLAIVQDSVLGVAIAAQVFGHVHKDELRILPNPPPGAGPIILSSSISPIYNNPSFKIVQYNRSSGQLVNYKLIYSEMTAEGEPLQWKFGYDLLQTYPELQKLGTGMDALTNLTEALVTGRDTWKHYAKWYATNYPSDLQHYVAMAADSRDDAIWKSQRRQQYLCAMTIQTAAEFRDCLGVSQDVPPPPASRDEVERLMLGKLLGWASLSNVGSAKVVMELAARNDWEKLLSLFGELVESSLRTGQPLESVLADTPPISRAS